MNTPILQESGETPKKIGLIAGQGDFPLLITRAAQACGTDVMALCINGFTSNEMAQSATQAHWLELGQLGKAIELLQAENVNHLIMAGRIPHSSIFQYRHFDWRAMKVLTRAASKRADALLGAVCDEFAREGISVLSSSTFLKALMPGPGLITTNRPLTDGEAADVEFGLPIARTIAGQDIGQTIVVKDQMVVAVEGLEGTDKCIKRAGELAGPGCVIVKVSKPDQDLRFDVPVIGPGTVKSMIEAKSAALALTSGRSLIFHRDQVIVEAEANGIGITVVDNENIDNRTDSK